MGIERGKFIEFEGVGGSGKTTMIKHSKNFLQERGVEVEVLREPGGVEASERIREFVFELKGEDLIDANFQMALFFTARKFLVEEKLGPGIEKGVNFLKDRGNASTAAYQGYGEGEGEPELLTRIEKISKKVMGEYRPDAIILLDITAETSLKRNAEYKDGDPFDDLGLVWTERVVEGYRAMQKNNWGEVDWYLIDAEKSPTEVLEQVQAVLTEVMRLE